MSQGQRLRGSAMSASDRLIGKACDYEVLAASHGLQGG